MVGRHWHSESRIASQRDPAAEIAPSLWDQASFVDQLITFENQFLIPGDTKGEAEPFGAQSHLGDCFLAGFAFGILRGLNPARAARFGNYCGARAVETVGVPKLVAEDLLPLLAPID